VTVTARPEDSWHNEIGPRVGEAAAYELATSQQGAPERGLACRGRSRRSPETQARPPEPGWFKADRPRYPERSTQSCPPDRPHRPSPCAIVPRNECYAVRSTPMRHRCLEVLHVQYPPECRVSPIVHHKGCSRKPLCPMP
jgi:hypothetical protein